MKQIKFKKKIFLLVSIFLYAAALVAQVNVEVNIDMNHQVGGVTSMDRSKWMIVSSNHDQGVWDDVMDKYDYIVNDLDAYFGRATGHITSQGKNVKQDPNRKGFADPNDMKKLGDNYKSTYKNETDRFAYEKKSNLVTAMQQVPMYPNGKNKTNGGWYYSSTDTQNEPFGTAVGEFAADYFNNFFGNGGTNGCPMPEYFEIMNEPIWHFVDGDHDGGGTINKIFKFHKTVADIVHDEVPGLKVGGFATAFPDFDNGGNLAEWDERWRPFIKDYGSAFDFYSIHLYDRPIENGKVVEQFRKGGRNEATLDMIEHYNTIHYGKVKPMLITEYGGQLWGMSNEDRLWRPHNDWRRIEAFNAMLMQFLERPNTIERALPFSSIKGEWGYDHTNDIPYRCRLLRKANEPASYSGEWVWTEYIKFYELWSEVKGKRVDSYADNLDFQVDAYVYGKEVYVILNNIESSSLQFDLNLKGLNGRKVQSVKVKRLYFTSDEKVKLTTNTYTSFSGLKDIKDDETIVLKYTFDDNVNVNQTSKEKKYYATEYKKSITADTKVEFTFKNVTKGSNGEAVVRFGLARKLDKKRFPHTIRINGTKVDIPTNYRGDQQRGRKQFFGMLEVAVPFSLLKSGDNTASITFADTDGFVSSCALQVFDFSRSVERFGSSSGGENDNNDDISISSLAGSFTASTTTFPVTLSYSASQSRDLVLNLQEPDGTYITTAKKTVSAGSGTSTINITVSNALAVANDYKVIAAIRPEGGNWETNILTKTATFNIVAESSSSNEFYIVNYSTGKKLRFQGTTDGDELQLVPAGWNSDRQRFTKIDTDNGYFYLKNVESGMYFRPTDDTDGSVLIQRPTGYNGSYTQWKQIATTGDYFYLQNRSTGMYFRPDTDADYSPIVQCPTSYTGTWTQWKFIDVNTGAAIKSGAVKKDKMQLNSLEIFPNPVKSQLLLQGMTEGDYNIAIYNIHGKLMRESYMRVFSNTVELNISELPVGIYLLNVQDDKLKTTLRFIKNE